MDWVTQISRNFFCIDVFCKLTQLLFYNKLIKKKKNKTMHNLSLMLMRKESFIFCGSSQVPRNRQYHNEGSTQHVIMQMGIFFHLSHAERGQNKNFHLSSIHQTFCVCFPLFLSFFFFARPSLNLMLEMKSQFSSFYHIIYRVKFSLRLAPARLTYIQHQQILSLSLATALCI